MKERYEDYEMSDLPPRDWFPRMVDLAYDRDGSNVLKPYCDDPQRDVNGLIDGPVLIDVVFGTPTRPLQNCDFCSATWPHPPHNAKDGFHDGDPMTHPNYRPK